MPSAELLRQAVRRWAAITLTVAGLLWPLAASAEVTPGDVITRANQDKIKGLVPDGVQWCVNRGMTMTIVPYKKIELPPPYQTATEKYSAQVKLKGDQTLEGYVAGRPFPLVDANDPQAATKIMYNFERGQYFSDDLAMHLFDADTGQITVDRDGKQHYTVERHFVLDWLRILSFAGRIYNPPIPAIEPNRDQTFRKAGLYPVIEPFDLKGVGGINYRYLDPLRQDDLWLYLPSLRRVRRLSSAQRSEALFAQDIDVDSYGGYAGQIPWFEWKFLGSKAMLASLHGEKLPPVPCKDDGGATFCESWEMRPEMLIIEGIPKAPAYAYSKRLIYIDHETFFIAYTDLYDRGGEIWKVVMQSLRTSTKPNPKVAFSYPIERMFIYAFTTVDMQLEHATRVAIPGMGFQDEPAWYVDMGDRYGGEEGWYTIAALISAGH